MRKPPRCAGTGLLRSVGSVGDDGLSDCACDSCARVTRRSASSWAARKCSTRSSASRGSIRRTSAWAGGALPQRSDCWTITWGWRSLLLREPLSWPGGVLPAGFSLATSWAVDSVVYRCWVVAVAYLIGYCWNLTGASHDRRGIERIRAMCPSHLPRWEAAWSISTDL